MKPFRWLKAGLQYLFALLILFEEWGWEPMRRIMARLMRLPILAQLGRKIRGLSPMASLAALLIPSVLLVPIKLSALWLIHDGHALLGVSVIVAAKFGGTALLAQLFHLTQPALMQMAWFARLYGRWSTWKDRLLAKVRGSWSFRVARVIRRRTHRQALKFLAVLNQS